jgi:uncharacterized membrane protein
MGKPHDTTALAVFLTCAALTWAVVILVVPLAASHGRVPLLTVAAYEIGSRICHQRPERSFHLAGVQMPVCARCFGLYAGGAAGLMLAWIVRLSSGSRTRLALAIGAAPIAVTVGLEWIGLIQTSNAVRWLTGVPLGLVAGFVIVRSLTSRAPAPSRP